jgi:hypothetical protein
MTPVVRLVLRINLESTLDLWLAAIKHGDYTGAAEIMTWRLRLQAALRSAS